MHTPNLRTHKLLVARISVPFDTAIRQAGPWTTYISPEKKAAALARKKKKEREILLDSLIWQAEPLYRNISNPVLGEVTLTLLNFGSGSKIAGPTAVLFAETKGLRPASPYEVFGVGIQHPTLYHELKMEPAAILSPEPRMFDGVNRVCCVWLGRMQKECAFVPFDYPLHDGYWFAFVESE